MSSPQLVLAFDDELFASRSTRTSLEGTTFEVALAGGVRWLEKPCLGAISFNAVQKTAAAS